MYYIYPDTESQACPSIKPTKWTGLAPSKNIFSHLSLSLSPSLCCWYICLLSPFASSSFLHFSVPLSLSLCLFLWLPPLLLPPSLLISSSLSLFLSVCLTLFLCHSPSLSFSLSSSLSLCPSAIRSFCASIPQSLFVPLPLCVCLPHSPSLSLCHPVKASFHSVNNREMLLHSESQAIQMALLQKHEQAQSFLCMCVCEWLSEWEKGREWVCQVWPPS